MTQIDADAPPPLDVFEVVGRELERAAVPGGWLYRSKIYTAQGYVLAMTFVPAVPAMPAYVIEPGPVPPYTLIPVT